MYIFLFRNMIVHTFLKHTLSKVQKSKLKGKWQSPYHTWSFSGDQTAESLLIIAVAFATMFGSEELFNCTITGKNSEERINCLQGRWSHILDRAKSPVRRTVTFSPLPEQSFTNVNKP